MQCYQQANNACVKSKSSVSISEWTKVINSGYNTLPSIKLQFIWLTFHSPKQNSVSHFLPITKLLVKLLSWTMELFLYIFFYRSFFSSVLHISVLFYATDWQGNLSASDIVTCKFLSVCSAVCIALYVD